MDLTTLKVRKVFVWLVVTLFRHVESDAPDNDTPFTTPTFTVRTKPKQEPIMQYCTHYEFNLQLKIIHC